jgi:hypothetical protein
MSGARKMETKKFKKLQKLRQKIKRKFQKKLLKTDNVEEIQVLTHLIKHL